MANEMDLDRRKRRPATVDFYTWHGNALVRFFGADRRLSGIAVADVQEFIDQHHGSPQTIRHDLQASDLFPCQRQWLGRW